VFFYFSYLWKIFSISIYDRMHATIMDRPAPGVLAASRKALEMAGRHGLVRVMDID
jgi:hypothetical protein